MTDAPFTPTHVEGGRLDKLVGTKAALVQAVPSDPEGVRCPRCGARRRRLCYWPGLLGRRQCWGVISADLYRGKRIGSEEKLPE
jgi:hypothetical protein